MVVSQLSLIGVIAAIFMLSSSEDIYAFEERNIISKQQYIGRRPTKLLGRRKGFIFGIGAGVGNVTFTAPLADYWGSSFTGNWPDPREIRSAFATELKVGHGFSDQFLLYYSSRITWLPLSNLYNDTMIVNGIAGLGIMVYPLLSADFYLVGTTGLAVLTTYQPPFRLERARQTGLAVSCGVGYELLPQLTIDFSVNFGNARNTQFDVENNITLTGEIITYLLTINLLAY
ncbi:hypothetical protein C6497_05240 [Candidatus Poribacteria bacterium]|nr:MAG: hypothetical protein C6497_05240 [Candidatus Poribacteria bacterium]